MKQEDKVCTKEQSQRLVELGIILETEKGWYIGLDDDGTVSTGKYKFLQPCQYLWDLESKDEILKECGNYVSNIIFNLIFQTLILKN